MSRERRQSTQTIAWFRDLYNRDLLDLDPPYQRRSVWNQSYKDYFVETILLHYPSPAVFLYENISAEGDATYAVVDGKQRLSTIFEFARDEFPVSEKSGVERFRGYYFSQLPDVDKKSFWTYQFGVEYLPTTDEGTLNNIFDRINRNVARLTPQELRHAKFEGEFSRASEDLTEFIFAALPGDFPRIAPASKRQMKDVELIVQLLLLIEEGVRAYSQNDLDLAYATRDAEWEQRQDVEREFREVVAVLQKVSGPLMVGNSKRLRNQADFYSLFGSLLELRRAGDAVKPSEIVERLSSFFDCVSDDVRRPKNRSANRYYDAARSASNDLLQRRDRIDILLNVIRGEWSHGDS